jgi:hypothetical protein
MDIRHLIVFDTPVSADIHNLLTTKGARPDSADPLTWLLPSARAFKIIEAALKGEGIPFEVFFESIPTSADDPRQLAAGMASRRFANLDVTPDDLVLATDGRTLATVVSRKMKTLLEPVTRGVEFDPLSGHDGFFVITKTVDLPEPVIIPRAVFLSEGDAGIWAVQSDGRELLTDINLRVVREHGLVHAPRCIIDGKILPWRRPPIFSGPTLDHLRDKNIQGALSPVFLGHAAHEAT